MVGLSSLLACVLTRPPCLVLQRPAETSKHRPLTNTSSPGCAPWSEAAEWNTADASAARRSATPCLSEVRTSFSGSPCTRAQAQGPPSPSSMLPSTVRSSAGFGGDLPLAKVEALQETEVGEGVGEGGGVGGWSLHLPSLSVRLCGAGKQYRGVGSGVLVRCALWRTHRRTLLRFLIPIFLERL